MCIRDSIKSSIRASTYHLLLPKISMTYSLHIFCFTEASQTKLSVLLHRCEFIILSLSHIIHSTLLSWINRVSIMPHIDAVTYDNSHLQNFLLCCDLSSAPNSLPSLCSINPVIRKIHLSSALNSRKSVSFLWILSEQGYCEKWSNWFKKSSQTLQLYKITHLNSSTAQDLYSYYGCSVLGPFH